MSLIEPGDLKPGMVNARKAEGSTRTVAKRATDIMRAEEAVGTDPRVVAAVVERIAKGAKRRRRRYLVGPDAWLVEALGRLVPHAWKEYFLASHYRVPPRENAWIRV